MKRAAVWMVAGALALSGVAMAQSSERVTLVDGTVLQGELVEKVPGQKVVLKLATGEVRTIEWSAIAQQAESASQAPPPPQGPPPPPQEKMFHVEVTADRPGVVLEQLQMAGTATFGYSYGWGGRGYGVFEAYSPVCVAPCSANVPASSIYRVAGSGVTISRKFQVPMDGARLRVSAGSAGARVGGAVMMAVGAGFLIGGLIILPFAFIGHDTSYCSPNCASQSSLNDTLLALGAGTAGLGALLLGIGIPLFATSATSVTSDDGQPLQFVSRNAAPKVRWEGNRIVF